MLDSFVSSAIFSVVAVGLLDFFCTQPLFSLTVASADDVVVLQGFVVTSSALTGLVRRLHNLATERRVQARLLDLTHDAIIVRDRSDAITY